MSFAERAAGSGRAEFELGPAILFSGRPARPLRQGTEPADAVILDLEDAVAPDRKAAARQSLVDNPLDPARTIVRINGLRTSDAEADLTVLHLTAYRYVMLPKASDLLDFDVLARFAVIALCETAEGILAAESVAQARLVVALMWGAEDLVASMGGHGSRGPDGRYRPLVAHARAMVAFAAAANERATIDAVHLDIADVDGLAEEARDAAALDSPPPPAFIPTRSTRTATPTGRRRPISTGPGRCWPPLSRPGAVSSRSRAGWSTGPCCVTPRRSSGALAADGAAGRDGHLYPVAVTFVPSPNPMPPSWGKVAYPGLLPPDAKTPSGHPSYSDLGPPKLRHTMRNALIALAAVLVVACGLVVSFGIYSARPSVSAITKVSSTVNSYLDAIETSQYDDAYALLCVADHETYTRSTFEETVAAAPRPTAHKITNTTVNTTNGAATATVTANLTFAATGEAERIFRLTNENGNWRLCGNLP